MEQCRYVIRRLGGLAFAIDPDQDRVAFSIDEIVIAGAADTVADSDALASAFVGVECDLYAFRPMDWFAEVDMDGRHDRC